MYYENFKNLCDQAGVTPGEVSRHTGVASSTLTMWKQGAYTPKTEKLQKIADYFVVSLDYLRTGTNSQRDHFITQDIVDIANKIKDNADLKKLFDVAIASKPSDIEMAQAMLERLLAYSEQLKRLPQG